MRRPACAIALAGLIVVAGCATQAPAPAALPGPCGQAPAFAAGGERATLWVRASAEYRAASESTFRAARAALAAGLADPAWTAEPTQQGNAAGLPPAVVMDIDETVLDNSEPQAEMLLAGTCLAGFAAAWDAWIARRSAPAVPGAAEFIRAARDMKDPAGRAVRVFLITNRECARRAGGDSPCPQEDDTLSNLQSLGLDAATLAEDLMLKGEREAWGSEKLARRRIVAASHRIVLNIGDDLADFLPDVRRATPAARERARCGEQERWGRQWFLLPNPMYGSWLVALGPDFGSALASEPPAGHGCPES